MRVPILLLPALALLSVASCRRGSAESVAAPSPAPVVLAGQIFTLRGDGLNLPLGGVEVSWVPADRLRAEIRRIHARTPRIEALLAYETTLREAESRLARIREERRAGAEGLDPLIARADWTLGRHRGRFESNPDIELILESPRFAAAHPEMFRDSGFEQEVQSHWMLVQLFVARIEALRGEFGTSDADGRFHLRVPPGSEGFLLAHARTSALGAVKHDYWLLPAGPVERDDLILSSRSRLEPRTFREILAGPDGGPSSGIPPEPPDLKELYGLHDPAPAADALARFDEVAANLDQRDHLERRIAALRDELSRLVAAGAD